MRTYCHVALALATASISVGAYAQQLDQQSVGTCCSGLMSSAGSGFRRVQTVTAGLTGDLVLIQIQPENPAATFSGFNILDTSAGTPTTTVIGNATYTGTDVDGWASFTTSIFMPAGQVFGLEPIGGAYWVGGGSYAGGSDFFANGGGFEATDQDRNFRTYVAAAVPEPATWAMMLLGFGAVGFAMRRRKQTELTFRRAA